MNKLLFQNPIFHPGLNVTCRRGDKWFKRAKNGEIKVQVAVTDGDDVGTATIVGYKEVDWTDANDVEKMDGWLVFEHDPSCRDVGGLMTEMESVYGEEWASDPTTVLFFVMD